MQETYHKIKKIVFFVLAIVGLLAIVWVGWQFLYPSYKTFDSSYSQVGLSAPATAFSDSSSFKGGLDSLFNPQIVAVQDRAPASSESTVSEGELTQRKVIKNGNLTLLVKKAEEVAESIKQLASRLDGFVSNSRVYEVVDGIKSGTVTIRVPADNFDQAIAEIKQLSVKVESENISASDVTEQFVDLEARLRNLRAQEQQFLKILDQADTVEDTLKVVQQLNNVRAQIELLQGQLQFLERQVDMSTITTSLTSEADVEVFGIRWRPLFIVKQAFRDMLQGLTGYVNGIVKLIFRLPVILLWLATVAVITVFAWKIVRWIYRKFFATPRPPSIGK